MNLLLSVLIGIVVLLVAIIRLKLPAFIALLLASICSGLSAGLDGQEVMDAIKNGMAGTLGFVATVVGLGAIFGGILEKTGGATVLANWLLKKIGIENAPVALMLTGFVVGIPVFFDVGIIILFSVVLAIHQQTGKSIIYYAVPLLSGLAVTHAFIPPTPGPIAVAEILNVGMGQVILAGFICGLPAAAVAGLGYGRYLGGKIDIQIPETIIIEDTRTSHSSFAMVSSILLLPIILIVFGTLVSSKIISIPQGGVNDAVMILGHPFGALLLANILAWYILGNKAGFNNQQLADIASKSLRPAGIIILVTGAGGVFKQILVDTGAGTYIAEGMKSMGMSIIVFAYLSATIIRVLQGSATVAMITAAGLVAPLMTSSDYTQMHLAAIVIAIASGATMASHVNDSGFWLVKEYFRLNEKQAIRTWTVASTIIGITGFLLALVVFSSL